MLIKIYEGSDPELLSRKNAEGSGVTGVVADIIKNVREKGDAAVYEYTERFDGARLNSLRVTEYEISEAVSSLDPEYMDILREAAANIAAYHKKQVKSGYIINDKEGVILGQKVVPLKRVGLYIPGGTASYPSSVLMNAVPASIAGVGEVIMITPPSKDGKIKAEVIAAAAVAGISRIYKAGGAQAVAALAYGTESIPAVDKIVGPGNRYVAEAKKQVFGTVDIDMIAGPSEIMIIADADSDPVIIAADLLSQAEHDPLSSAILITDSRELAGYVSAELEKQIALLPRADIARASIDVNGKIIIVSSINEAICAANSYAPEHLELYIDDPFDYLDRVENAGSVFLGRYCPEALGDYFSGTNHTLPTGGTARFSSPLSVDDFVKKFSFTYYTREALRKDSAKIARFAESEGLSAHARSAVVRFENISPEVK